MPKLQRIEGSAKGISFELALKDAMKKVENIQQNIPSTSKLVEFRVEDGGVVGPMSIVIMECASV